MNFLMIVVNIIEAEKAFQIFKLLYNTSVSTKKDIQNKRVIHKQHVTVIIKSCNGTLCTQEMSKYANCKPHLT